MSVELEGELPPPALELPPVLSADEIASYSALRTDAVWWDADYRWSSFRGEKAAEALNGLVTNDVTALAPGNAQHAAALSPKGKLVTDMIVVRVDATTFLLAVLTSVAPAWIALARKYVNPRLCTVTDEGDRYRTWLVYGARAPQAISALLGDTESTTVATDERDAERRDWPAWHHASRSIGPAAVRLVHAPLLGTVPGFVMMADATDAAFIQDRLDAAAILKGTPNLWNVARVEAGRPAMSIDMDENTIPQEANLDTMGAISFTKGCYTGQETVARVHFRGHVNRHLRGLTSDSAMPMAAQVTDASGKVVGDVRSTVVSPRLGPIAMGMIRREVPVGSTVSVSSNHGPIAARVVELPFPAG